MPRKEFDSKEYGPYCSSECNECNPTRIGGSSLHINMPDKEEQEKELDDIMK